MGWMFVEGWRLNGAIRCRRSEIGGHLVGEIMRHSVGRIMGPLIGEIVGQVVELWGI